MSDGNGPPDEDATTTPPSDESADLWFKRGLDQFNHQHWAEAIRLFDHAIELNASLASAWAVRGAAYFGIGDYPSALRDADYALALFRVEATPNAQHVKRLLPLQAEALFRLGRYHEALGRFAELQQLGPLTAYQWTLLGDTHRALRQHKETVSAYHQALIHPERAHVADATTSKGWSRIARFFLDEKVYDDALEASRLVASIDPGLAQGWGLQAEALLRLRRPVEALTAAQQARDLDTRYVYGWVAAAQALRALKRYGEAHDAYHSARLLLRPQSPEWNGVMRSEVLMLLRTRRFREAWQEFMAQAILARHANNGRH